jgi:hypothetical protein
MSMQFKGLCTIYMAMVDPFIPIPNTSRLGSLPEANSHFTFTKSFFQPPTPQPQQTEKDNAALE